MMDAIRSVLTPVHREGRMFVIPAILLTALLFWLYQPLGWFGAVLSLWCVYFFRDPDRMTPVRAGLVVSPADGVVQSIVMAPPPAELDMGTEPRQRISIFMNVFNVHVNRVPADGTVTRLAYAPGKFLNATLDKASEDNERQAVRMSTPDGGELAFVQIAGLIARRIVCDLVEGQEVKAGERFGIIRFGSRLDVYLDGRMTPLVCAGQTAVAGETVLADSATGETPRRGESR